MSKSVPNEQKCNLFKTWLENWIKDHVKYDRAWIIPIDQNKVLGNVLNVSKRRPMKYTKKGRKERKLRKSRKY